MNIGRKHLMIQMVICAMVVLWASWMHQNYSASWSQDKHLPVAEKWEITFGFVFLTCCGLLLAIFSAWYPLLGFIAFTALHRGVYRYSVEGAWLHHSGVVSGVLLLGFTGWILWRIEHNKFLKSLVRQPLVVLTLVYMVWILIVEIIARVHHPDYVPFLLRDWSIAVGMLMFVLIGLDSTRSIKDLIVIGFSLVVIIYYRTNIMEENIWLDEESAHLAVTTMPLLASVVALDAWFYGLALGLFLCAFLGWTLVRTNNRGGYLGLLAGVVATPIVFPWRIGLSLFFCGVALAAGILIRNPDYLKRFTEIRDGGKGLDTIQSRLDIYEVLVKEIPDHFWFGVGMGRSGYLLELNAPEIGLKAAHNTWLVNVIECGVLGAVFFNSILLFGVFYGLVLAFSRVNRRRVVGGVILCFFASYFAISLGHNRDLYESMYVIVGAAAALASGSWSRGVLVDA
jgi:hypothetical protein